MMNFGASYNLNSAVREGNLKSVRDLIDALSLSHSKKYGLLCDAVQYNHLQIVKLLLKNGATVNGKNKYPSNTPLHLACINGNIEIVEILLDKTANIHAENKKGRTPLHNATEYKEIKIIELLLTRGVDINARDNEDITPLHIAAQGGHLQIVELLLKHGAHVDSVYSANCNDWYTPLYLATIERHEKIVKLLLECGANVDICDKNGKSLLYFAVEKRYITIVEYILEHGPDINNESNRRSLEAAVLCNCSDNSRKIVTCLLQYGFTVDLKDVNNYEMLHSAIEKGYLKIVEGLLKHGADINKLSEKGYDLPLHTAAQNKQEEIAELLICFGADVNAKDKAGNAPIYYAIRNANFNIANLFLNKGANVKDNPDLLLFAVVKKCNKIVKIILQHGADSNAYDKHGRTALHSLFEKDNFGYLNDEPDITAVTAIAKLLLRSGTDVNSQTKEDLTVLHKACREGFEEVVETLLEYNANINVSTENGVTPLHFSAHKGNEVIVKMLLDKGANVNAKQIDGTTALHITCKGGYLEIVKLLIRYGANTDARVNNECGRTALHFASERGYKEIVEILLKYSVDSDIKDVCGTSALHLSSGSGHKEVVELLLKSGVDIDAKDEYGRMALHIASEKGHEEIVNILLKFGTAIHSTDEYGRTALHIAAKGGHAKVAIALMESGSNINIFSKICDYTSNKVNNAFKNHLTKLRCLNICVKQETIKIVENSRGNWIYLLCPNDCNKELLEMKSEKISTNVTFHDMLITSLNRLVIYARNEDIVQALKAGDFKTNYPIYANMINTCFEKGTERKNLLEQGCNHFQSHCNSVPKLPIGCIEMILNYLSNNDLKILICACKPSIVRSPKRPVDDV